MKKKQVTEPTFVEQLYRVVGQTHVRLVAILAKGKKDNIKDYDDELREWERQVQNRVNILQCPVTMSLNDYHLYTAFLLLEHTRQTLAVLLR